MKNNAGWVALGVLVIATLTMIFGVLPNIGGTDKDAPATAVTTADTTTPAGDTTTADGKAARTPAADEAQADKTKSDETKTTAETASSDAKPADAKPADPTADWVVPAFDILRVEPDGSTVIAGRAQPGTKLEIVNGDQVIATADVGQGGDFAAVFDKPLAAGDYQLSLRSVGAGGLSKGSQEVATISVPKDNAGDLLAMVSKPGEASRLITTPTAEKAGTAETKTADATAGTAAAEKPVTDATAGTAAATGEATDTAAASAKPADAAGTADTQTQADAADTTTGDAAAESTTAAAADAKTAPAATAAEVQVSAVEIEGDKMFVAGAAKPGALVRIYADDKLVGERKADEQGRFVIDGIMPLSVGSHVIRADMLNADGSKVDFRAAVPFDRPEGEQIAVVADPNATTGEPAGAMTLLGGGTFDKMRGDATKAFGLLKALFAEGKVPTAEQLAAARSATEIALGSLAEFKLADTVDAGVADMATRASKGAADALAMLKALPADAASVSAALGKIEAAIGVALMPRTDEATPDTSSGTVTTPAAGETTSDAAAATAAEDTAKLPEPAGTAETSTAAGETATPGETAEGTGDVPAETASEPKTVEQAPLKQSKTSVIIRRGDTLWQISRRVYGAGVRYTTIYLANEDQITNPDKILPGQVFGVPDEALPDSEALHRKRLKVE